jgi:periodic tryptophan protein 1
MAAVTSLCWIPRSFARTPVVAQAPKLQTAEEVRQAKQAIPGDDDLAGFNMDGYDDEDESGMQFFSVLEDDMKHVGKDPYLRNVDVESDEDEDDTAIRETDLVFAAASAEEDHCSLEIYVYSEEDHALFVRHDMLLDAYPLCTAFVGGTGGDNCLVAVGTFDSVLQLWDPNVEEAMEPALTLGVGKKDLKGSKKNGKKKAPKGTHTDAVIALDSSKHQPGVLASGSADHTVRLWDVHTEKHVTSFSHHTDKVQVVQWHPTEAGGLLTAGFDKQVCAMDVRQQASPVCGKLPADAESATWLRHDPACCVVSCEDGNVLSFDVRNMSKPKWTLRAHDITTTVVRDTACPQMLVTCSTDETAKVWKDEGAGPKLVFERNLQAGPLFACQPCNDEPRILGFTGKCAVVWDVTDTSVITEAFGISE